MGEAVAARAGFRFTGYGLGRGGVPGFRRPGRTRLGGAGFGGDGEFQVPVLGRGVLGPGPLDGDVVGAGLLAPVAAGLDLPHAPRGDRARAVRRAEGRAVGGAGAALGVLYGDADAVDGGDLTGGAGYGGHGDVGVGRGVEVEAVIEGAVARQRAAVRGPGRQRRGVRGGVLPLDPRGSVGEGVPRPVTGREGGTAGQSEGRGGGAGGGQYGGHDGQPSHGRRTARFRCTARGPGTRCRCRTPTGRPPPSGRRRGRLRLRAPGPGMPPSRTPPSHDPPPLALAGPRRPPRTTVPHPAARPGAPAPPRGDPGNRKPRPFDGRGLLGTGCRSYSGTRGHGVSRLRPQILLGAIRLDLAVHEEPADGGQCDQEKLLHRATSSFLDVGDLWRPTIHTGRYRSVTCVGGQLPCAEALQKRTNPS